MATVWVARVQGKHGFEKLVAVKTILPHLVSDKGFRDMFLDEAAIASRIRHPNVADVVDLGEERGTLYMVLEWINGDSWSKLFAGVQAAGHTFPVPILLRIAAEACAGLHAAHELRDDMGALLAIVHRDVTPQNILITVGGVTKVIDFGIAKALDRSSEATQTGMLKGKAQYMAPEQAKGGELDRRADIWAIGTILYQYLSGRLPYEGKNDLFILRELTSGKPPPPLPAHIPDDVKRVVMTALQPDMRHRFQTALDMQRALEAVIPTHVTSTDVAAFMARYLEERIETRRKDLADALNELDEAAGRPKAPRTRKSSIQELARPAILDQVLGPVPEVQRQGSSPSLPSTLGPGESGQTARLSTTSATQLLGQLGQLGQLGGAGPSAVGPSASSTRVTPLPSHLRDEQIRPVHYAMMVLGAVVSILVWAMVGWVATHKPADVPASGTASGAASGSASGAAAVKR